MDSIVTACIVGGLSLMGSILSLIGVIYTNSQSNKKVENQLLTAQAVTDQKIEQLTEEVRRHNSFGDRIIRLEETARQLKERVEQLSDRITKYHDECKI